MNEKYDIHYTIQFHSDWHCGSGLSAGADVDALVIKDIDTMLPFVPGKTIKGLVREAIDDIATFRNEQIGDTIDKAFGSFVDMDNKQKGYLFFKDATLPLPIQQQLTQNNASRFMYRSISSTRIDDNGIAADHSLRKIEVAIPCELEGEILGIENEEMANRIKMALQYIKRLGQGRNRGLGRCTITINSK